MGRGAVHRWPARIVGAAIVMMLSGLHSPPEAAAQRPSITEITMGSTPAPAPFVSDPRSGDPDGKTYGLGETIKLRVAVDAPVRVTGDVTMDFWIGDSLRVAEYRSGHGSSILIFAYVVGPDDQDDDGISIQRGYIDDEDNQHGLGGSGTIEGWFNEREVKPEYSGSTDKPNHKVDGSLAPWVTDLAIASTPASGSTYRYGEDVEIDVTFSAPVRVGSENRPWLPVIVDEVDSDRESASVQRTASYSSGSGTARLRFALRVKSHFRDDDGFEIYVETLGDTTGTSATNRVIWAKDHDVRVYLRHKRLDPDSDHKLNGQPYVKQVAITSRPERDNTYRRAEVIQITVTFDQKIRKSGQVTKGLLFNSTGATTVQAGFASGDGARALVFEYTVESGDGDTDGLTVLGSDNGGWGGDGTLRSVSDPNPWEVVDADRSHGETANAGRHKVDGSLDPLAATISSMEIVSDPGEDATYVAGDWIGVKATFDKSVEVTGTPQLEVRVGTQTRTARFGQGSFPGSVRPGNRTAGPEVFFGYRVEVDDIDTDGIAVQANRITLDGGTIVGPGDTAADLNHDRLTGDPDHKVDAVAPTVSALTFSSDAGDDSWYGVGDTIEVTVTFSEDVTVTGSPQLELMVGNKARAAAHDTTEGAAAIFAYVVQEGDRDGNGIAIDADTLGLPDDGTIEDRAGNAADLSHEAAAADGGHRVDGSYPKFKSAVTSGRGYVNVNFTEGLTVPAILNTISSFVNVELGQFFLAVMRIKADGEVVRPTSARLDGAKLRLNLPVTAGQSLRVDYDNIFARDAVGLFIDRAGNPLANFGSSHVLNQSTVAAEESDVGELKLSLTELRVDEGVSETYTVALEAQPSDTVAVAISSSTTKLSVSPDSLSFTPDDWNTAQTVTLTADQDDDEYNYWVSVTHTGSGGGYDSSSKDLYVVIDDDDD